MKPESKGWGRVIWAAVLLLLLITVANSLLAQFGRRKSSKRAAEEEPEDLPKPQLLHAETNPTLRYPIASFSGITVFSTSYGWLDVSRNVVRYTPVQPRGKLEEGFEAAPGAIYDVKIQSGYLRFHAANKHRTIFYLPPDRWGSVHSGPGALHASSSNVMGTAAIQQALRNFDRVLATVKPPPPPAPAPVATPAPEPAPPPRPPTIVLMEPSIAVTGQTVEVRASSLAVRGVAMDPSGLPMVTVNGNPANMKPRNAQAVEFWSDALPLKAGENSFEVAASNAAHAQAKLSFTVRYNPPAPPPPKVRRPTSPNPVPLAKAELLQMLKSMSSAQVAALVNENGISFIPTPDDLKEIRQAGGADDLIQAVTELAPSKSS